MHCRPRCRSTSAASCRMLMLGSLLATLRIIVRTCGSVKRNVFVHHTIARSSELMYLNILSKEADSHIVMDCFGLEPTLRISRNHSIWTHVVLQGMKLPRCTLRCLASNDLFDLKAHCAAWHDKIRMSAVFHGMKWSESISFCKVGKDMDARRATWHLRICQGCTMFSWYDEISLNSFS